MYPDDFLPYDRDSAAARMRPPAQVLGAPPSFPYVGLALTPSEFADYVSRYDFGSVPPDFVVFHHTGIPAASWAPSGDPAKCWDAHERGLSIAQINIKRLGQLGNLMRFYRDTLGWSAGPHLFIDDRWIYLMTPMYDIGIHAKWGNSFHVGGKLHYSVGIEVIGDYTRARWPAPVVANVRAAVRALASRLPITLDYMYADGVRPGCATNAKGEQYCPNPDRLRWGGLSSHRDYNKPECPGGAITEAFYLDVVRGGAPVAPAPAPPAPAAAYTADSPILGTPRGTVAQACAFLQQRAVGYTHYDILSIVTAYRDQAAPVGVDWFLALAQLCHETGSLTSWWAQRPIRNPAGIGVTGAVAARKPNRGVWQWHTNQWEEGLAFATWRDHAIPAHLGRLLAYALRDAEATAAQRALISRALAYRALDPRARGSAPTLTPLGALHNPANRGLARKDWCAGWAWDGAEYGARIAERANLMLRG